MLVIMLWAKCVGDDGGVVVILVVDAGYRLNFSHLSNERI